MRLMIRPVIVVYWIALTLWVSVIVAAGVAATGVFTILPDLGLTIDGYVLATPAEHGRLVAGKVMEPIFTFVDVVQVAAAAVVLITLAAQLILGPGRWRGPANLLRTFCLAVSMILLGARLMFIAPTMNHELRAYWAAAQSGEIIAAEEHRAAFEEWHPTAARMFNVTLILLLVSVGASALALGPARPTRPRGLEEPLLARQR